MEVELANEIEKSFSFLKSMGFHKEEDYKVFDSPLVKIFSVEWKNKIIDREICIAVSLAIKSRPSRLSVIFKSPEGNFTLTDWLHFSKDQVAPVLIDTEFNDIISHLRATATAIQNLFHGQLGDIIKGKKWIDVPTYGRLSD